MVGDEPDVKSEGVGNVSTGSQVQSDYDQQERLLSTSLCMMLHQVMSERTV